MQSALLLADVVFYDTLSVSSASSLPRLGLFAAVFRTHDTRNDVIGIVTVGVALDITLEHEGLVEVVLRGGPNTEADFSIHRYHIRSNILRATGS